MLDFLLNNSILIIFVITASFLARNEYKRRLQEKSLSPQEFRSLLHRRSAEIAASLLGKLLAAVVISIVISMISFRELWMNDTFHIVFLTLIMAPYAFKLGKSIFE